MTQPIQTGSYGDAGKTDEPMTTDTQPVASLTLGKIREAMKLVQDMPPPPFLAMCSILPAENFTRFEHEGREYWGAHPDLWDKVPKGTLDQMGWMAFKVHNLDVDLNAKAEFYTALMSALTPKDKP